MTSVNRFFGHVDKPEKMAGHAFALLSQQYARDSSSLDIKCAASSVPRNNSVQAGAAPLARPIGGPSAAGISREIWKMVDLDRKCSNRHNSAQAGAGALRRPIGGPRETRNSREIWKMVGLTGLEPVTSAM